MLCTTLTYSNNAFAQNSQNQPNSISPGLQILQPSKPIWDDLLVGISHSVAISGNGQYVLAGTENGKTEGHLYLYDHYGNLLWDYKADRKISTVAISQDGDYIAAGGYQLLDNGAGPGFGYNAWSANPALYFMSKNGTLLWKYEPKEKQTLWHVAMPLDGSYVLANIDGSILSFGRNGSLLWNYTSGNDIGSVSVSSDGSHIVTNTQDHVLYLDNTGKILWSSKIDSDPNARSSISSDGKYVLASSSNSSADSSKLYLFDNKGNLMWTKSADGSPGTMSISADDYYIAESAASTKLFDLKGNLLWSINSTGSMALSPTDSYVLMTGNFAGQTSVIAYDSLGNNFWRFPIHDPDISEFSASSGGQYLAFATSDQASGSSTLYYFKIIQNFVEPKPAIVPPPLEQVKWGAAPTNVTCRNDLELVIKAEDGTPACVSPENVAKLVKIGWARQEFYYHDVHVTPKVTLNDYSYIGIENNDNVTVSINNQAYYQTTLDYSVYNLPRATPIKFHNVTFTFPEGTMPTPGGALVALDLKFQDGFEETYGKQTVNPDGSGSGSGIPVPSQYGLHAAVNSTTVLSNHMEPQAGITIYHDKIKLLVSTDANSPNISIQTSNSADALTLNLSTSSQMIKPGQAIGITISVNNTLSKQVTVSDENSWKLNDLSADPCGSRPYGVAILSGFYSEQNVTEGKPLPIFSNAVSCPFFNKIAQSYTFQPSSGHVILNNCPSSTSPCSFRFDLGSQLSFSGIWSNGENQQPFSSGLYTIVGGDEWGHVAIEHFVVSNSTIFAGELGATSCPAMTGGIQFSATVKNSTGFSNYYNSTQYGNTFFLHPEMKGIITVQYNSPANAAWFQNHGNIPFNMTNGAALLYMANVTEGKSVVSYAASLYNDEMGHHSQICHYGTTFGGFMEPCNFDNKGDIPSGELPYASKVLHVGVGTSFEPNSVMFYPNTNPVFTATVSANSDAMPGAYWLSLGSGFCGPGVLARLIALP